MSPYIKKLSLFEAGEFRVMEKMQMVKTIKWISVLVLLSVISGCISYSSTILSAGKGDTASTTINGKTAELKDGVLTYEGKTFDVPYGVPVRIERRNDEIVRNFVDGKLVHEEKDNTSRTRQ